MFCNGIEREHEKESEEAVEREGEAAKKEMAGRREVQSRVNRAEAASCQLSR